LQFQVILQQDQKFRDVNQWSELIVFTYKKSISIFFVPFIRRCVHHNYDVISGSHACRDCVWHIILDAELCTTCPEEGVLVATRFNVTFLPLRHCYVNTPTCISKDAENPTTYGYVL